jgi:hypothetical protein
MAESKKIERSEIKEDIEQEISRRRGRGAAGGW